jgi:hypothetical protein
MKAEINIEEIIKKANETKLTIEGAQDLVTQMISFKKIYKSNGIIKFKSSYEIIIKKIDNLLARYTTNNNIDKTIDSFTGKEKLISGKFEKLKKEFLNILNEVQIQFDRKQK